MGIAMAANVGGMMSPVSSPSKHPNNVIGRCTWCEWWRDDGVEGVVVEVDGSECASGACCCCAHLVDVGAGVWDAQVIKDKGH